MSDDLDPGKAAEPGPDLGGEPIGSVGEEAAKLFTALSGWLSGEVVTVR